MRKLFNKIRRNFIDYGLFVTLKKMIMELLSPVYRCRKYRIYAADLERINTSRRAMDTFTIRVLQPNETNIIDKIEKMEEWLRGQIAERLGHNAICIIALEDDMLAGFNLISFGEIYIPLINMKRVMKPDEAWSEQISVGKQYRGRGLGKTMRYVAIDELRKRNISMLYGGTLRDNRPSLALARSVGFREVMDIDYFRILGKKLWKDRKVTDERITTH